MKYQHVAALLLAAFSAGCAELRWHKDDADTAAISRDFDECRLVARSQAAQQAIPTGANSPRIVGVDAQGRAIMSSPGQVDTGRFLAEHDFAQFCMRNRGYELVPAKNRDG